MPHQEEVARRCRCRKRCAEDVCQRVARACRRCLCRSGRSDCAGTDRQVVADEVTECVSLPDVTTRCGSCSAAGRCACANTATDVKLPSGRCSTRRHRNVAACRIGLRLTVNERPDIGGTKPACESHVERLHRSLRCVPCQRGIRRASGAQHAIPDLT